MEVQDVHVWGEMEEPVPVPVPVPAGSARRMMTISRGGWEEVWWTAVAASSSAPKEL